MPDFTARLFPGAVVEDWVDSDFGDQVRRTNPTPGAPHRRYRVTVGDNVQVRATVNGVEAPLDGALGGRLFMAWFVEHAGAPVPIEAIGGTSIQQFKAMLPGHYAIAMSREGGGTVIIHLDAVNP